MPKPISIGHPGRGGVAVAGRPQPLDRLDVVAEALPGEGVVVEVLARRAHRPERERVAVGVTPTGRLDRRRIVVGQLERHGDDAVDVVEAAPGPRRPVGDRPEERVRRCR